MKLSEFKIVEKESELTPNVFIVIIGITVWTPDYPCGKINIVTHNGKNYVVTYVKGLYKNMLERSNMLLNDKEIQQKFNVQKKYNIFIGGIENNIFQVLLYKNFQGLIDDCLVLSYPYRIDYELDDDTILFAIKNKTKALPPSIN